MNQMNEIIEQSFIQYSGAVIQSRALVDVRDGLKPSARQILYTMYKYGYNSNKSYHKTAAIVGETLKHFYIHGDSSAEGIIMRSAQPFALRYPFVDVKGNVGSQIESGNWAAPRYTESRLSKLGDMIFTDLNKDTITEWKDNYANDEQYPVVLPTKGFYGICNGTSGIAVGMASSVPQYNIRELNTALIYLIDHPDCSFEDIYCAPDFATGAILYNESEVKESMKNGSGFACKLRSVVDYNNKERCFVVTEIPYSVYTNTICGELEKIINDDANPGIERFNDLTGEKPLIKIYLTKRANPDRVLKYLYKNTSLQSYFGINFTMLDMGRFPKVFTWKEMLQAHIDHEKIVYRRGFEFDLKKINDRIHIIDGLLICLANIDEVVEVIKSSSSTSHAATALCEKFILDNTQAKAVLDMKLSRLAKLEVEKFKDEKAKLVVEAERINTIISNEELFNNEIKEGWRATMSKYGDERRTKILDLTTNDDDVVEEKAIQISLTNKNHLLLSEISTLYTQRRGGVGAKLKLAKDEYVISTTSGSNTDTLLLFSNKGNSYTCQLKELAIDEKIAVESVARIQDSEKICALVTTSKKAQHKYVVFLTKKGMLKKSSILEYASGRASKAITLEPNDEIRSVLMMNDERVGMLTKNGRFMMCETKDIRAIGRIAKGVKGIGLNTDDELVMGCIIPKDTNEILTITSRGYAKRTKITEISVTGRATKGNILHKLKEDGDVMIGFLPIINEGSLLVISSKAQIKLNLSDIALLSRGTMGNKLMKIGTNENIIGISKF